MLRATDFFRKRFGVDEVKLLLIDACIECECDKIAFYAVSYNSCDWDLAVSLKK